MKKILPLLLFICWLPVLRGQQMTMFSNFADNQFFYNPSLAGAEDYGELRGMFRSQWQGVEDAPTSQYLGYQQGLDSIPFGLGLLGFSDQAGQLSNIGAMLSAAYHWHGGEHWSLSFGVSAGLSRWTYDPFNSRVTDPSDRAFENANTASATPLVNIGLNLRWQNFYLNFSSPQILESEATVINVGNVNNKLKRHYFATTGYRIQLSSKYALEPMAHLRYFETAPEQLDLGIRFHLSNFWTGGFYRGEEAISIQAGLELADVLAIYYAYDATTSALSAVNNGSHEIGIAYLIGKNRDTDEDGTIDKEDECPKEAGPLENNGCPVEDGDNDGIPDDQDECPNEAGLAKYAGCPDVDGDGLIDKIDACPKAPGKPGNMGCPDSDGDGIPDQKDECPDLIGLTEHRGCPDTDGDGISDKLDNCPGELGPIENSGCPWSDSDGDGIMDNLDQCPTIQGLKTNGGCPPQAIPDTDGDGIADDVDECPRLAGTVSKNGCPQSSTSTRDTIYLALVNLDFDSDNSTLKQQSLPYLDELAELLITKHNLKLSIGDASKGLEQRDEYQERLLRDRALATRDYLLSQGVPNSQFFFQFYDEKQSVTTYQDTDGDSVTDNIDKCPRTAGPKSNDGCPEVSESQEETIYLALVNLEFEFDKSIIKPRSFRYLDQLAELMVRKRDWKLRIAGHTDNIGSDEYNIRLSRDRALATRNYLISRGMANTQFVIQYYGETQPIDTNETELGRQRNRRVELEFVFD